MIISASRRTDIPSYYSDWFINRIKNGYVLVRNPMNHLQVSKILLNPNIVDCIVFWTKDAEPFVKYIDELTCLGYKFYFQYTITPYGHDIEPNIRRKDLIVDNLILISEILGRDRVVWRYDPIIINDALDLNYHAYNFERLCYKLHESVHHVVISFVDLYRKNKNFNFHKISTEEGYQIAKIISNIANRYNLKVETCCEDIDLSSYGIEKGSCVDKKIIEKICGYNLDIKIDPNQRTNCLCAQSIDIGSYDTWLHKCNYCYANNYTFHKKMKFYDKNMDILCDKLNSTDKVYLRETYSFRKMTKND